MARDALRLPRSLHPGAWWLWALGMATAASRTTNPLLLGLILAVLSCVVAARRGDAPWARGFRVYLLASLVIIAIRVGFRILLDGQYGATVLFTLPEIPLPEAARGIRIGGPVSLEGILAAFYEGLRLATLLCCFGAASVLADPKRLLKSLPSALYEVGVAVTVALTFAPQLIESAQRVRRARRLRGDSGRGRHFVRRVAVPVVEDALDRSLSLAAAMDARGYGRTAEMPRRLRVLTGALVLLGLGGVCVGTYGVLDGTTPRWLGAPMLVLGAALAAGGFLISGRRIHRSTYRPDPWRGAEWAVALSGFAAAAVLFLTERVNPDELNPSLNPLQWPTLAVLPVLGIAIGLLPAFIAPPVARSTRPKPLQPVPAVASGRAS